MTTSPTAAMAVATEKPKIFSSNDDCAPARGLIFRPENGAKIIIAFKKSNVDQFGFNTTAHGSEIVIKLSGSVDNVVAHVRNALELAELDENNFDPAVMIKGSNLDWVNRTVNLETIEEIVDVIRDRLGDPENQHAFTYNTPAL